MGRVIAATNESVPVLGSGFRLGHWTSPTGTTGCTVLLPPPGNVCAYDMRGGAPGSRELGPLDLARARTEVHAIALSGGSAFGLAVADGVMAWLEERGVGFAVGDALIPIVPAAVILDASAGNPAQRPGPAAGRAACEGAGSGPVPEGRVGAGAGGTVGKWAGREFHVPGGLGVASAVQDGQRVAALAVVNSVGDVIGDDGQVLAGTTAPAPVMAFPPAEAHGGGRASTVLAVVTTRATLDKRQVHFLAARGSDGIAVAVRPAHTQYDGDLVFAVAAPGQPDDPPANVDVLGMLATRAVAQAIRRAVLAGPDGTARVSDEPGPALSR
jgi:L-aminopeptidase/D-esterase-like protein